MKVGDRVKICGGRGKGHVGVIQRVGGRCVELDVPALKAMGFGTLTVMRSSVALVGASTPVRVATFTPYRPDPFRVPRPGSEIASRLPSVAGAQLLYPRGLR